MPTTPDTSWTTVSYAQVLQKNLQSPTAVVPRTMRKVTAKGRKDTMEATTMWEDPSYRAKNMLRGLAEAYSAIQEQLGDSVNKAVRPIAKVGRDNEDRMMVEYKFKNKEDTKKAIEVGLTIKGVQYKGALVSNVSSNTKMVEISISQLQAKETDEEMVVGLRKSMRFFGKVVKIVKFTHRGWFEGNVKVFLDKTPVEGKKLPTMAQGSAPPARGRDPA
ncbi:hypothetical protein BC940DRAFT_338101 [Gongronella butleri]|nr:hypothetical protein BC940DRAFT_338101 [Gongronella butleri]